MTRIHGINVAPHNWPDYHVRIWNTKFIVETTQTNFTFNIYTVINQLWDLQIIHMVYKYLEVI